MTEKLHKALAHAGYGSRRQLEQWIKDGRITVNGKRAELGIRVSVQDKITVDGKPVRLSNNHHQQIKMLAYHKPEGEVCTRSDPQGRKTVFENLPSISDGRWVSVGRLDINTSGLLLFTNNGDLANKLMHPSTGLEREYLARVRGTVKQSTIQQLTTKGIELDGRAAAFDRVEMLEPGEEGSNHWYRVVIREGRYREVRRLWEAAGHPVSRLKRIRYGTIKLSSDLRKGKINKIAPMQLQKLLKALNLYDQFDSHFQHPNRQGANRPKSSGRHSNNKKRYNKRNRSAN